MGKQPINYELKIDDIIHTITTNTQGEILLTDLETENFAVISNEELQNYLKENDYIEIGGSPALIKNKDDD